MAITRYSRPQGMWNMMDDLMDMRSALDSFFTGRVGGDGGREGTYTPLMNAFGTPDEVVLEVELPGVDPKAAEIQVNEDVLTVKGRMPEPELKEGESWHRQERPTGEFVRTVKLPFKIDMAKVTAVSKNGILRITLPRTEAEKPKRIDVKIA